jgi:predicted Zn-dependent protease
MEKKKPGFFDKTFATHPMTPDRVEKAQEEISRILPAKPQYLVDTSEFQDVKSRLAKLQNRRRIDNKKESRPSLRRGQASDPSQSGSDTNDKKDDDHPTLHRRD